MCNTGHIRIAEERTVVPEQDTTVYVDVPDWTNPGGALKNVKTFTGPNAQQEAIDYCKEHFGADDQGKFTLITGAVTFEE